VNAPPPGRLVLRRWRPVRKGALVGFANITLPGPIALVLERDPDALTKNSHDGRS